MKKLFIIPLIFIISCGNPMSINQGELKINNKQDSVKYCTNKIEGIYELTGQFIDYKNNTLIFKSSFIYKIPIPNNVKYKMKFNEEVTIKLKCSNKKWIWVNSP